MRRLERGHHVSGRNGRLSIVESETGRLVEDLGPHSPGKRMRTPRRRRIDAATLNDVGWIEWVQWANGASQPSIASFGASWTVPPAPLADDGHTIFFFIGLQQAEPGPYILQPVLQWGPSIVGGGSYWSISNWYVNGQGSVAIQGPTPLVVAPGTPLQAQITCTGQDANGFSYTSSFAGHPEVDAEVRDQQELAWACITLEGYGANFEAPLASCDDYPDTASTVFSDIAVKVGLGTNADAALDWGQPQVLYTSCGQSCTVLQNGSPNGAVEFAYNDR